VEERCCIAIDLKSFYASVECVDRGLDPLTTNLVVADQSRTEKTICLAVSPSLKAYGIPGRARLFEVVQQVELVNARRLSKTPDGGFAGTAIDDRRLRRDPTLKLDYLVVPPRMARYVEKSTEIYNIYLRYAAPEDIHVYSIDEVFIEATDYIRTRRCSPLEFTRTILGDVLAQTGITATAGIGTNLYLSKVAMDILAKKMPPDENGTRIAQLDEMSYRRQLWTHRPLTDFWRVGRGTAKKLEDHQLFTMGDVARCSLGGPGEYLNEALLYRLFGVNAELLIDHAWGYESCTMADIKAYRPASNSISAGQVLQQPYVFEKGKLIVREMTDSLVLELVDKGLVTDQMELTVGYDVENLTDPRRRERYRGPVVTDHYGRAVPKEAHGTQNLGQHCASTKAITRAVMELYDRVVDPSLLVRRMVVAANHVLPERSLPPAGEGEQLDLFTDPAEQEAQRSQEERERRRQEAILAVRRRYGKNALLKGMNLEEGATARDRNRQIGGHKA